MKNPLNKRLPRELRSDAGKYVVIFLFMIMLISLISGFLVSTSSMLTAYNDSFEKYNTEHGHMTFDKTPPAELLSEIEERGGITLYKMDYFEENDLNGRTSRVYAIRDAVNLECVMSGEMPSAENEIAIDRLFAKNNDYKIGDTITLNGKALTISGFVALPDYSCLYEKNTDMMFDALNFNVGVMTEEGIEYVGSRHTFSNYGWKYNCEYDREDKVRAAELSDGLIEVIKDIVTDYDEAVVREQVDALTEKLENAGKEYAEIYMTTGKEPTAADLTEELDSFLFGIVRDSVTAQMKGEEYTMPDEEEFEREIDKTDLVTVKDYVPQYLNNGINFAAQDMSDDKATMTLFGYIVIFVLVFIFAITISDTIVSEAGVIGTLRASGFTKGEITRHYLILPTVITFIAAAIGNILGYTIFKDIMADLYYNSYSLTTFNVIWNSEAFISTTLVPVILMVGVNYIIISRKLKLSPLKFLRRDLRKKSGKKAFRLNTKIPFKTRFKLRIIFQNLPGYIVMICGIFLGGVVIIFGTMFSTIFDEAAEIMLDSTICDYQYVLMDTVETADADAEKYCMTSYEFTFKDYAKDSIAVYGIEDNSRYVSADVDGGKVAVSNTIREKFGLDVGDEITLTDPYKRDTTYSFTIDSIYQFDSSLAIFISRDAFNEKFAQEPDYFSGYFTNRELSDIDSDMIAAVITKSDYTKICDQMNSSVGSMMTFVSYFGTIMFILIMYILSKQVIERNFQSISMCKILGFKNGEISGLYIMSTSAAVLVGILAAIPLTDIVIKWAFKVYLYKMLSGYFPCLISPMCYVKMAAIGVISYAAVAVIQMIKINKISKSEALKNVE